MTIAEVVLLGLLEGACAGRPRHCSCFRRGNSGLVA